MLTQNSISFPLPIVYLIIVTTSEGKISIKVQIKANQQLSVQILKLTFEQLDLDSDLIRTVLYKCFPFILRQFII